jgi:histidine kinase
LRTFGRTSPTSMQPVSVAKAVTGALTLINNVLDQNNIDIDVNIDTDLPMILGVESQLEQVFINLIANAVDAISDVNPDERTVLVEGTCENSYVCVMIKDTGGGMSDVDLEKVFEPFFTTKAEGKGTGLGGSISYGIVSSFGGTISASNWEKGAEFTLVFPALEPS